MDKRKGEMKKKKNSYGYCAFGLIVAVSSRKKRREGKKVLALLAIYQFLLTTETIWFQNECCYLTNRADLEVYLSPFSLSFSLIQYLPGYFSPLTFFFLSFSFKTVTKQRPKGTISNKSLFSSDLHYKTKKRQKKESWEIWGNGEPDKNGVDVKNNGSSGNGGNSEESE